jgi:iron complex transport system ATP-binding protein
LNLNYGEKRILENINLEFAENEIIGIIGSNGSGKSTLLKCINRLIKTKNSIIFMDEFIENYNLKELSKKICIMNQNTMVNFPFKSLEVVLMGRHPYIGRFQKETKEDINLSEKNMIISGTNHLSQRPVTNLSGGEKQRIFYAKTITQDTKIILLDEPTSNLDLKYQEKILNHLKKLVKYNKTVIIVLHDIKTASKFCSKLILMKSGIIIAKGKPKEVITENNIKKAYDINPLIIKNNITDSLDIHILKRETTNNKIRIHVIAGGNSAKEIFKILYKKNQIVSTGVLFEGDVDLEYAKLFNFKTIQQASFSNINSFKLKENIEYIKKADLTILSNFNISEQNMLNINACKFAKELIIIEDIPIEKRDFTKGKALEMYSFIRKTATITISRNLKNLLLKKLVKL